MTYFAELGVEVPAALQRELLARAVYVSDALREHSFDGDGHNRLSFQLAAGKENEAGQIARHLAELAQELCRNYRRLDVKILARHSRSGLATAEDPHPALLSRGALIPFGSGRFGWGPELYSLIEAIDRSVLAYSELFYARPYAFPALVGAGDLARAGYLRSFPQHVTLALHLREDLEAIRRFARAQWTGEKLECLPQDLSDVRSILAPTVCVHAYAMWAESTQPKPMTLTARGHCFRYESSNLTGLERLWDFSMREIVFLGPPEWVVEQRDKMVETCTQLLKGLTLSFEIRNANDAFFLDDFSTQTAFQNAFDLKFEMLAQLPYQKSELAVGSINYHRDHFARSFGIADGQGRPLHSACVGFGLERLALAVLSQCGTDPQGWPESLRPSP